MCAHERWLFITFWITIKGGDAPSKHAVGFLALQESAAAATAFEEPSLPAEDGKRERWEDVNATSNKARSTSANIHSLKPTIHLYRAVRWRERCVQPRWWRPLHLHNKQLLEASLREFCFCLPPFAGYRLLGNPSWLRIRETEMRAISLSPDNKCLDQSVEGVQPLYDRKRYQCAIKI